MKPRRFTADELAAVRTCRRIGVGWRAIAAALDRDERTLTHWFASQPVPKPKPVRRPCLTCARPILSEGSHHRRCNPCRARSESPFEPDDGNTASGSDVMQGGGVACRAPNPWRSV